MVYPFTVHRSVYFFRLLHSLISFFTPTCSICHAEKIQIDRTFANQRLTFCLEKYIRKKTENYK